MHIASQLRVDASSSKCSLSSIEFFSGAANACKDVEVQIGTSTRYALEGKPEPAGPRPSWFSRLRRGIFNVYGRLCFLMIAGNVIPFIYVMATQFQASGIRSQDGRRALIRLTINMASGNAMVCVADRSPLVINGLFLAAGLIPLSAPLWLRKRCAKIYHYGGVHSGTGVAACMWMMAYVVLFAIEEPWRRQQSAWTFILSALLMALLLAIVVVAAPGIRRKFHDIFESTHRFGGWLALFFYWVLLFLQAVDEVAMGTADSVGAYIVAFPAFWFLLFSTAFAAWAWSMLRKVPVYPEYLSPHATRLHFRHRETSWGRGLSLARHPLKDWHSFAAFTDRFDTPTHKFSCLVSNAGDWTKSVIQNGPTELWVRAIPVYGVGYAMKLFKRVVMVATGSGVGPCLSFIGYDDMPPMRVIWQTRNPLQTYGQRTLNLVRRLDANPVIMDTKQIGRVEMFPIVRDMVAEFQAEAVIVISNPALTKKLVYQLEQSGINAYGPIFDS